MNSHHIFPSIFSEFSFLAVREDPQYVSPAKPTASSRVSGAWKKVRRCFHPFIIEILQFRTAMISLMNVIDEN